MKPDRLFHISENAAIKIFDPRPSPSYFEKITGNVVFAISNNLLHNYLFPRECPRVTFYPGPNSLQFDKEKFFGHTSADFIVAVEIKWFKTIQQTPLYCYELPAEHFLLIDKCAGYYISYEQIIPIAVRAITAPLEELLKRNIELRIMPNLWNLANEVVKSSLNFSLIRMRNAIPKK